MVKETGGVFTVVNYKTKAGRTKNAIKTLTL
jgi:hypothetical protein